MFVYFRSHAMVKVQEKAMLTCTKPFRKRSICTATFKVWPTAAPEEDVSAILKVTLASILTLVAFLTIHIAVSCSKGLHSLLVGFYLVCKSSQYMCTFLMRNILD